MERGAEKDFRLGPHAVLNITNPNPFGATAETCTADVFLVPRAAKALPGVVKSEYHLGVGRLLKPAELAAKASTDVSIEIHVVLGDNTPAAYGWFAADCARPLIADKSFTLFLALKDMKVRIEKSTAFGIPAFSTPSIDVPCPSSAVR